MRLDEITRRGFLKGAAAGAASAIPKLASAKTKWVPFIRNWAGNDGVTYYYDAGSLIREGNEIQVWIKLDDQESKRKLDFNIKEPKLLKINVNNRTYADYDKFTNRFENFQPIRPDQSTIIDLVDQLR